MLKRGVFLDTNAGGAVLYYHYGRFHILCGECCFCSTTNLVVVDSTVGYGDGQKRFGWNLIDWGTGWPVV